MSRPDDPMGRRSLFSAAPLDDGAETTTPTPIRSAPVPADPLTADTEPAPADRGRGRRALFSTPQVTGPSVVVACRTCRARTPVSLADLPRTLIPSLWLPFRPWSRWMRCPSCGSFSWCRVEWGHLIAGG